MNAEGRRLVGLAWSGLRISLVIFFSPFSLLSFLLFSFFFFLFSFSFSYFFFFSFLIFSRRKKREGCGALLGRWTSGGSAGVEGGRGFLWGAEEAGEEGGEEELRGTKEGDFWVNIEKLTLSTIKQPADPLRRVPRVGNRAMFQLQARWLKVLFQSSADEARPK